MNVLRSLAHRPFALLWPGQTIFRLGAPVSFRIDGIILIVLLALFHPAIRNLD
jgi:hypothetical protein